MLRLGVNGHLRPVHMVRFFLNVTAFFIACNGLCRCQWYCSHSAAAMDFCVWCHTWICNAQCAVVMCMYLYIYIQIAVTITVAPCEQFHKIACKKTQSNSERIAPCERAFPLNSLGLRRLMVFAKRKPKWPSVPYRNAPWDPNLLNKPLPNKNLTLTGCTFSYRYRVRLYSHWAERTRNSSLNQGVWILASPVADPPLCGPKFS